MELLLIIRFDLQIMMPDVATYRQHFEAKHPKAPTPPELAEGDADDED